MPASRAVWMALLGEAPVLGSVALGESESTPTGRKSARSTLVPQASS